VVIKLNEKDIKILKFIDRHGIMNLDEIARGVNISRSTIHYRMKKFFDKGAIKRTIIEIDPEKLSLDVTALVFVYVDYEKASADELGECLSKVCGVSTVYYVLGDVDFIVILKAKDKEDLKRTIKDITSINGVVRTGTHFVVSTVKEEKRLLINYTDDALKKLFDLK
jgi:DNA-binding Lrp family transcriptional regulator